MPRQGTAVSHPATSIPNVAIQQVARALGKACGEYLLEKEGDLLRALQQPNHPLHGLLYFMFETRQRKSHGSLWRDVQQQLAQRPGTQSYWFRVFLSETFALYCVLRRRAAPRAKQPAFRSEGAHAVGRVVARQLRITVCMWTWSPSGCWHTGRIATFGS